MTEPSELKGRVKSTHLGKERKPGRLETFPGHLWGSSIFCCPLFRQESSGVSDWLLSVSGREGTLIDNSAIGRVSQTKIGLLYQKEDRHPNKIANMPSKRGFHKMKENLSESESSGRKPRCAVKAACLLWELLKSSRKLVCSLFRVGMSAGGYQPLPL